MNIRFHGGQYLLRGTLFTCVDCPGGQYSPVNSVGGDIIHSDTDVAVNVNLILSGDRVNYPAG